MVGSTRWLPKPDAFDWISDTPIRHAVAVDTGGAQVGGVAVVRREQARLDAPSGIDRGRVGASIAASRARPSARSWSTSGRSKPAAVAASIRRCAQRGSSGSSGRSSRSARRQAAEGQIALRVGRDRVEIDAERRRREWAVPRRPASVARSSATNWPVAEIDRARHRTRRRRTQSRPPSRQAGSASATRAAGRGRRVASPARRARPSSARERLDRALPSEATSSGLAGKPSAASCRRRRRGVARAATLPKRRAARSSRRRIRAP